MKDYDQGTAPDLGNAVARAASGAAPRRLELDIEKYQAYLDGSDLTPAQKEDFLRGSVVGDRELCRSGVWSPSRSTSLWKSQKFV